MAVASPAAPAAPSNPVSPASLASLVVLSESPEAPVVGPAPDAVARRLPPRDSPVAEAAVCNGVIGG